MKLVFSIITAAALLLPATPSHAATLDESKQDIVDQCSTGLRNSCSTAVCASVSSSFEWDASDQAALGAYVAGLVTEQGVTDPGAADAIQACAIKGPRSLVSAFQGASADSVADAGGGVAVSPH